MDINEMRRKFREKKEAASTSSPHTDECCVKNITNEHPVKRGDSSTVKMTGLTYNYEKGGNAVSFSCDKIENNTNETTGTLWLCAWISENERVNGDWQNDNYAFLGEFRLGVLKANQCQTNVSADFSIQEELQKTVNKMSDNYEEWHFVFTVNESHEDGNKYIIHTVNGENEAEPLRLPIGTENVVVWDEGNFTYARYNNRNFTGTLYASNNLCDYDFKNGKLESIYFFHENGEVSCCMDMTENQEDPVLHFYNENGTEINQDIFTEQYDNVFMPVMEESMNEFNSYYSDEDVDVSSESCDNYNSDTSHSSVFSKVKSIVVDKLGVEPYEVVESASFMSDLGADSLDAVELIMEFEKEFGITIPDEIAERIHTVGDAVKLLEKNI